MFAATTSNLRRDMVQVEGKRGDATATRTAWTKGKKERSKYVNAISGHQPQPLEQASCALLRWRPVCFLWKLARRRVVSPTQDWLSSAGLVYIQQDNKGNACDNVLGARLAVMRKRWTEVSLIQMALFETQVPPS